MSHLLDKKDKNTTSFTFSKIDSINVKNNIGKENNVSTCNSELCTQKTIKRKLTRVMKLHTYIY